MISTCLNGGVGLLWAVSVRCGVTASTLYLSLFFKLSQGAGTIGAREWGKISIKFADRPSGAAFVPCCEGAI